MFFDLKEKFLYYDFLAIILFFYFHLDILTTRKLN